MNEEAQLKAIAAEYQVAGYRATIDPVPGSYGLPEDMPALDMVVRRTGDLLDELAPGPRLIIVEIVNRGRMIVTQSGRGDDPYWAQLDEAQAQKRFEAIADALDAAGLGEDDVDFQIRFLDVSADQAAARAFLTFSPWDTDELVREMVAMRRSVADSAKRADDRALGIVVSWARALRIIAHRFPGRKHAELQTADLRTIQKDLYDARILDTPPSDYFRTHQSILALFEGGEPEWPLLRGLEADLARVLDHIIAHYLEGRKVEPKEAAIDEGADQNVFEPLLAHIEAIGDENVRRLAREQFALLRRTDRRPAFRQHLIDFEQTIRAHTESFGALLDTLRERTRLIGG